MIPIFHCMPFSCKCWLRHITGWFSYSTHKHLPTLNTPEQQKEVFTFPVKFTKSAQQLINLIPLLFFKAAMPPLCRFIDFEAISCKYECISQFKQIKMKWKRQSWHKTMLSSWPCTILLIFSNDFVLTSSALGQVLHGAEHSTHPHKTPALSDGSPLTTTCTTCQLDRY